MPKLKSKNNLQQTMWLSMPAIVLACSGLALHHLRQPVKPVLALEKVEPLLYRVANSRLISDTEVRVVVNYRSRDWGNRLFKTMPRFTTGRTNIVDSNGKIKQVDMAINIPTSGVRKENILAPGSDGSLRYLFIYHIYLPTAPKPVGVLRLKDSISAEGVTVPIDIVVRH